MGGEGDQEGLEKNTMFCRKIEAQCSGGFARHKVQFDWTLALSALQLLLARGTNYSLVLIGYKFKPLSITAAFSKKKNNLFFLVHNIHFMSVQQHGKSGRVSFGKFKVENQCSSHQFCTISAPCAHCSTEKS